MLSIRSKGSTRIVSSRCLDTLANNETSEDLRAKIVNRRAVVGVVGQGYVGFPLAQEVAGRGFKTVGYDINLDTVSRCHQDNRHRTYSATVNVAALRLCDVLVVAVPTPTLDTDAGRVPDLTAVKNVVSMLATAVIDGSHPCLVVVESTYAPGTTRNIVAPVFAARHDLGRTVFLGYSPERIDPGNTRYALSNTPKVTSGMDADSADLVQQFYGSIVQKTVAASSMEAAEATKMLENAFRFVNICFAQEFDAYCDAAGIQAREVTRLAASKPFGFMPFYAGPGIGGHCIAEDPYFLRDAMLQAGLAPAVLQGAIANHESRARVILDRITRRLGCESLQDKRILLLGVSYKPNIGDARRSPAQPILRLLEEYGANVDYVDPHVPRFCGRAPISLHAKTPGDYDLAIVLTAHAAVDYQALLLSGWPLLDTTGAVTEIDFADAPRTSGR